jgi:hypothetical protein
MIQFALMFHDCLNIYGWQKKAEFDCRTFFNTFAYDKKLRERIEYYNIENQANKTKFCTVNNTEYAPEVCNEFITIYCDEPGRNKGRISRLELIELT